MNKQERKQFLKNLKDIASAAANVTEIAYKLEFKNDKEFEKFLKQDKEAKKIWKQARLECWIKAKHAIVTAANDGKTAAIQVLDRLLKDEQPDSILTENITISQLSVLTGKSPQTVTNWVNKHGLPRESNKKFSLIKFIQWNSEYRVKQGKKAAGKTKTSNGLQDIKTKKLKLELAREKGELLNRQEVIAGIVARQQRLVQYGNRIPDLATQLEKKSLKQVIELLEQFFEKLILTQKDNFVELKLSVKIKNMFFKMLKMLEGK